MAAAAWLEAINQQPSRFRQTSRLRCHPGDWRKIIVFKGCIKANFVSEGRNHRASHPSLWTKKKNGARESGRNSLRGTSYLPRAAKKSKCRHCGDTNEGHQEWRDSNGRRMEKGGANKSWHYLNRPHHGPHHWDKSWHFDRGSHILVLVSFVQSHRKCCYISPPVKPEGDGPGLPSVCTALQPKSTIINYKRFCYCFRSHFFHFDTSRSIIYLLVQACIKKTMSTVSLSANTIKVWNGWSHFPSHV